MAAGSIPNIMVILIDCLRADRIAERGHAESPTLSRLARSGTHFVQTIAAATNTTPSVASMLTGRWPPVHGLRAMEARLRDEVITLQEILSDRGFRTVARVTGAIGRGCGIARGFADFEHRPESATLDSEWGKGLIGELEGRAFREPWFIFLHLFELHWPRHVPASFDRPACGSVVYDRALSALDASLAPLLASLPSNTIVSVLGDHGERLDTPYDDVRMTRRLALRVGRMARPARRALTRIGPLARRMGTLRARAGLQVQLHGGDLREELIRVPWIISGAHVPAGRIVSAQMRHIDLTPTLLALIGIRRPELSPSAFEAEDSERPAYVEASGAPGSDPSTWLVGLRQRARKLVFAPYAVGARPALFDLARDPEEKRDIADADPSAVAEMRAAIDAVLGSAPSPAPDLTPAEEAIVLKRLSELGYLEQ